MWRTVIIWIFVVESSYCGFEKNEVGSRPLASGGAYVALANDAWALFYNVAGLSSLIGYQVSLFYAPQPFGLTELSLSAVTAVLPTTYGVLGFSARRYGFELYRELSLSIGYAKEIAGVQLGLNLNHHSVSVGKYGSSGTIGVDIGLLTTVVENLRWGIAFKNINSPTIGISKEKLPQIFSTGFAFHPAENFKIGLDIRKETSFSPSVRFGCEHWIVEAAAFRCGIVSDPVQYSGGFGIQILLFQFDYGFTTHQVLGWTHFISLTVQ